MILGRLSPDGSVADDAVRLLHTLTGFETFDTMAGADRSPDDVTPLIINLAVTALTKTPPSV
jgi:hypothetical protein